MKHSSSAAVSTTFRSTSAIVPSAISADSMLVIELPVPLASKDILVMAPVASISQSEVSMAPVSPVSPRVKAPLASKVPLAVKVEVTVKVESRVTAVVIFPPVMARSPETAIVPSTVLSIVSAFESINSAVPKEAASKLIPYVKSTPAPPASNLIAFSTGSLASLFANVSRASEASVESVALAI